MKKLLLLFLFVLTSALVYAQYGTINAILDRLEERRGLHQNLKNISLEDVKFVFIKDFEDHTERNFIILKGKNATFVEMFDDKATGTTNSNVFSGDAVRSNRNVISVRFDQLEGKKIPVPVTKTLLLTQQQKILYLIDLNTKERWIEESALNRK